MVWFELWEDMVLGPKPETVDTVKLRKISTRSLSIKEVGEASDPKNPKSMSMSVSSATPGTPATPTTPLSARKENAWMSVFDSGNNLTTRGVGAQVFDKTAHPESPTVYHCGKKIFRYHLYKGAWE